VVAKVLGTESAVQLIVFFAVIREILKRKIYGGDKREFCFDENKGADAAHTAKSAMDCEYD